MVSGQRSESSGCPEGPTLSVPRGPSQQMPTHPLPAQVERKKGPRRKEREGGCQEQPSSELRAPHKGRCQMGLLCQLTAGGKGEGRGRGFPNVGRRLGRTNVSSDPDHLQQSTYCLGTQHRETIQPPIHSVPQGKIKGNSQSPLSAP